MLREKQRAEEAAKIASKAVAVKPKEKGAKKADDSEGEVFAEHYSPAGKGHDSESNSDIMSSQGTQGNINSPLKQGHRIEKKEFGIDSIAINGMGLKKDDPFQDDE